MPRHPEGKRAMTDAERSVRKRARKAAKEQHRLALLRTIANDPTLPARAREIARAAIEGKPQ